MARRVDAQSGLHSLGKNGVASLDIEESKLQEVAKRQDHWHRVLLVVRGVLREAMVAQVAGEEHVGVQPPDEADETQKHVIQPLGAEHEAVTQLVHAVDAEVGLQSIHRGKQRCEPHRPSAVEVQRQAEPQRQHGQEPDSLHCTFGIRRLVQSLEHVERQLGSVPVDGQRLSLSVGRVCRVARAGAHDP
jgi:hypothetical protein